MCVRARACVCGCVSVAVCGEASIRADALAARGHSESLRSSESLGLSELLRLSESGRAVDTLDPACLSGVGHGTPWSPI